MSWTQTPVRQRIRIAAAALGLAVALAAASPVRAQNESTPGAEASVEVDRESRRMVDRYGDLVSIFSGDVHVPAGTRQRGSVICLGGNVRIDGEVTQDVVVILGSLDLEGSVGWSVTGVLSDLRFRNAEIGRELVSVLGSIDLENTRVSRELINVLGSLERDGSSSFPSVNIGLFSWSPNVWALLFYLRLLHKLVIFVLILLVVAMVPERVRLIGEEAPVRYLVAFLVGILGWLGSLVVIGLLLPTVIGTPVAVLGYYILKWLGIAGIFYAVGLRLGRSFGRDMSVLGAVLLVFALYVAVTMAPGFLGLPGLLLLVLFRVSFFLLIELPALGLVILTVAGGRSGPSRRPRVGGASPPPPTQRGPAVETAPASEPPRPPGAAT